ncbi:UNVERIFIED_CONTAM: putative signal peptidase complex subunit [Sesamum angustifolium]|uniref:Signal peptidase complex subunit 1 n=1 Tax=Sesamum angustifolium TaxID=2727405 RepID=A0AAW2Q9V7_9LAMI
MNLVTTANRDWLQSSHFSLIGFKMDWQGQKLAEQLMQLMLVAFAVVAFIAGYVLGSFQTMLLTYAAGVVLTSLITIPNWPFFNRHPLNWLDPSEAEKHPKPQPTISGPKKKASKRVN